MSLPRMSWHIGDYKKDTGHLKATGHGAYFLLCMHYWATGGLPDDDEQLATIACLNDREWRKYKPIMQAFFYDGWKHKRIEKELRDAQAKYEARANAGQKGGEAKAKAKQNPSNATANPKHPITDNPTEAKASDVIVSSSATSLELKEGEEEQACGSKIDFRAEFDIWYAPYPHKVAKPHAFKAFVKARKNGIELVMLIAGLARYIRSKPSEISWCQPASWLNGERWTDQPSQQNGNGHETAKDAGKRAWNEARAKVREYANAPNDGDVREPALRLLSAAGNRES